MSVCGSPPRGPALESRPCPNSEPLTLSLEVEFVALADFLLARASPKLGATPCALWVELALRDRKRLVRMPGAVVIGNARIAPAKRCDACGPKPGVKKTAARRRGREAYPRPLGSSGSGRRSNPLRRSARRINQPVMIKRAATPSCQRMSMPVKGRMRDGGGVRDETCVLGSPSGGSSRSSGLNTSTREGLLDVFGAGFAGSSGLRGSTAGGAGAVVVCGVDGVLP
jgi:hypothetical protein